MKQLIYTFFYLMVLFTPVYAHAQVVKTIPDAGCGCGICCGAKGACAATCSCTSKKQTPITIEHITNAMNQHRRWMVDIFFKDDRVGIQGADAASRDTIPGILAAMQLMTEQLNAVAMNQVFMIGAMLDAKHQLETQRLFQQLTAQAHKDYHPSEGMCDVGTGVRSLAASERKGDIVTTTLANRMTDRQLLSGKNLTADAGAIGDKNSRLKNFIKNYCNKDDNGGGLDYLCLKGNAKPERKNKDVNFTQTLESPLTLKIDVTSGTTDDTEDLMALTANLFANDVMPRIQTVYLKPAQSDGLSADSLAPEVVPLGVGFLMSERAIAAKRSVAQNSIASIAGLKAEGSPESQPFIYAVLKEMGGSQMEIQSIQKYLGDKPSYFAQMEVLTKKMYQDPVFYTELYDKPANVLRKQVAIQAVELMQKRDMYRSLLRNEAVFSVMLENAITKQQAKLKNEIAPLKQDADLVDIP